MRLEKENMGKYAEIWYWMYDNFDPITLDFLCKLFIVNCIFSL